MPACELAVAIWPTLTPTRSVVGGEPAVEVSARRHAGSQHAGPRTRAPTAQDSWRRFARWAGCSSIYPLLTIMKSSTIAMQYPCGFACDAFFTILILFIVALLCCAGRFMRQRDDCRFEAS